MDTSWIHNDEQQKWQKWTTAICGSFVVGLSGIIPLILLPTKPKKAGNSNLNRQLSFAVGSLLGDVFLHLIPESYQMGNNGIWVILGLISFLMIEKIFQMSEMSNSRKIVGYLNLLANCIDNFVHGLAVASSFLNSFKMGLTTVLAILLHEIPHEIGDFAILLNSGFSRFEAAKAQFGTALIGLIGACFSLWIDAVNEETNLWILPFSAGGFLNIALVSVLPQILKEEDPFECFILLLCMISGVSLMAVLCMF